MEIWGSYLWRKTTYPLPLPLIREGGIFSLRGAGAPLKRPLVIIRGRQKGQSLKTTEEGGLGGTQSLHYNYPPLL